MLTRSGLGAAIAAIVLVVCGVWWRYEELVVAGVAAAVADARRALECACDAAGRGRARRGIAAASLVAIRSAPCTG